MLKNNFKIFSLLFILFLGFLAVSLPLIEVKADWPPPVSIDNPLGAESFTELVNDIAGWIFMLAIPLATVMFLIGGFQFLVSGGNEEKVTQAKKTMLWAAVGLAVCLIGAGFTSLIKQLLDVT